MSDSIFISTIVKSWKFIVNIFENSRIYKIFNKKSKNSKSKILRALIDEDISLNSKLYRFLEIVLYDNKPKIDNRSVFIKSLFNPLQSVFFTLIGSSIFLLLIYFLKIFDVKIALICIISFTIMAIFLHYILNNKFYKGSLAYRFFSYLYSLEEGNSSDIKN